MTHRAAAATYSATTSLFLGSALPSSVTQHTINFIPSDTVDLIQTITLQYATQNNNTIFPTGLSMDANPTVSVSNGGVSAPASATYAAGLVTITITPNIALMATSGGVQITILNVTNPVAQNFYLSVSDYSYDGVTTTLQDIAQTASTTQPGVFVLGTINPVLAYQINGVTAGTINGTMNVPTVSSFASSLPFGSFLIGTNTMQQSITISTNSANGYALFLSESNPLTSGISQISNIASSQVWQNGTTIGFGVNVVSGAQGDANTSLFTSNALFTPIPTSSSLLLASLASPTPTAGGDTEIISFQVGVDASIGSGTYTTTLNYTITPTL